MSEPTPKNKSALTGFGTRNRSVFVWICRIVLGLTFIVSGLSKMIDIWGFMYKIDQYLNVWGCPQPQSLVFTCAAALSAGEFLLGFVMLLGCYRKLALWTMMLIMLFFTPLSAYIAIVNPVPDCGCFGEFLQISNVATFLKNVVIMFLLVYLLFNNSKVEGLLTQYSQWLVGWLCVFYMIAVGMAGYTIQPLIDFRPYKVGTKLIADDSSEPEDAVVFRFIYEKDGKRQTFSADSLPDDSWTFVDREIASGDLSAVDAESGFSIYDSDGDDMTSEAIASEGEQLLLLIPELDNIDVSSTYVINEMNRYIESHGGSLIGILGTNSEGLEMWRDLSMASYPLYTAEDTAIKEVARGTASFVYLRDGVIRWKRTLSSIDTDLFESPSDDDILESLDFPGEKYFLMLTGLFLGLFILIFALDRSGRAVKLYLSRKNRKK